MFSSMFGSKKSSDSTSVAKSSQDKKEDKKAKLRQQRDNNNANKSTSDPIRGPGNTQKAGEDPLGPLKAGNNRAVNTYRPPATIITSPAEQVKQSKASQDNDDDDDDDDDSESSAEEVSERVAKFYWDLEGVNLMNVLLAFYRKHSPDKINSIKTILESYQGSEMLMLQMMCDLYHLTEKEMQVFVDVDDGSSNAVYQPVSILKKSNNTGKDNDAKNGGKYLMNNSNGNGNISQSNNQNIKTKTDEGSDRDDEMSVSLPDDDNYSVSTIGTANNNYNTASNQDDNDMVSVSSKGRRVSISMEREVQYFNPKESLPPSGQTEANKKPPPPGPSPASDRRGTTSTGRAPPPPPSTASRTHNKNTKDEEDKKNKSRPVEYISDDDSASSKSSASSASLSSRSSKGSRRSDSSIRSSTSSRSSMSSDRSDKDRKKSSKKEKKRRDREKDNSELLEIKRQLLKTQELLEKQRLKDLEKDEERKKVEKRASKKEKKAQEALEQAQLMQRDLLLRAGSSAAAGTSSGNGKVDDDDSNSLMSLSQRRKSLRQQSSQQNTDPGSDTPSVGTAKMLITGNGSGGDSTTQNTKSASSRTLPGSAAPRRSRSQSKERGSDEKKNDDTSGRRQSKSISNDTSKKDEDGKVALIDTELGKLKQELLSTQQALQSAAQDRQQVLLLLQSLNLDNNTSANNANSDSNSSNNTQMNMANMKEVFAKLLQGSDSAGSNTLKTVLDSGKDNSKDSSTSAGSVNNENRGRDATVSGGNENDSGDNSNLGGYTKTGSGSSLSPAMLRRNRSRSREGRSRSGSRSTYSRSSNDGGNIGNITTSSDKNAAHGGNFVSAIPGGYDGDNSTITSVSSLQAIQQANALVSPPGAGMILPQSTHPGQNTQKNPQSPVSDISASPSPRKGAPRGPMGGGKGTADPSIGMGSSEIEALLGNVSIDSQRRALKSHPDRNTSSGRSSPAPSGGTGSRSSSPGPGSSPRPGMRRVGDPDDDWYECYDPRIGRPYYHSKKRNKSTWTFPANLVGTQVSVNLSSTGRPPLSPTKAGSGSNVYENGSRSTSRNSSRPSSRNNSRASSPAPGSAPTSHSSSKQDGNDVGKGDWSDSELTNSTNPGPFMSPLQYIPDPNRNPLLPSPGGYSGSGPYGGERGADDENTVMTSSSEKFKLPLQNKHASRPRSSPSGNQGRVVDARLKSMHTAVPEGSRAVAHHRGGETANEFNYQTYLDIGLVTGPDREMYINTTTRNINTVPGSGSGQVGGDRLAMNTRYRSPSPLSSNHRISTSNTNKIGRGLASEAMQREKELNELLEHTRLRRTGSTGRSRTHSGNGSGAGGSSPGEESDLSVVSSGLEYYPAGPSSGVRESGGPVINTHSGSMDMGGYLRYHPQIRKQMMQQHQSHQRSKEILELGKVNERQQRARSRSPMMQHAYSRARQGANMNYTLPSSAAANGGYGSGQEQYAPLGATQYRESGRRSPSPANSTGTSKSQLERERYRNYDVSSYPLASGDEQSEYSQHSRGSSAGKPFVITPANTRVVTPGDPTHPSVPSIPGKTVRAPGYSFKGANGMPGPHPATQTTRGVRGGQGVLGQVSSQSSLLGEMDSGREPSRGSSAARQQQYRVHSRSPSPSVSSEGGNRSGATGRSHLQSYSQQMRNNARQRGANIERSAHMGQRGYEGGPPALDHNSKIFTQHHGTVPMHYQDEHVSYDTRGRERGRVGQAGTRSRSSSPAIGGQGYGSNDDSTRGNQSWNSSRGRTPSPSTLSSNRGSRGPSPNGSRAGVSHRGRDDMSMSSIDPPVNWIEKVSRSTNQRYFYNTATNISTYRKPDAYIPLEEQY